MASRREQMAGASRSRSTRSDLILGQPHPQDPSPHRGDHDATSADSSTTTPRRRGSSSNNHGQLSRTGSARLHRTGSARRVHRRTGSEVLRDFERRSYGADVVPDPPSIFSDLRGEEDHGENDDNGGATTTTSPIAASASAGPPGGASGDERRRLFAAAGGASSSAVTEMVAGGRRDVLLQASADDAAPSISPAANIHLLSTPRAGSGGGRRWPNGSNNSNGARTGSRRSLVSDIPSRTGDDFSLEWSLEDGDGDENDDSDNWGDEDDEDGIDRYHQFMHSQQRSQRTIGSLPDEDDDEYMTAYRLRLRRMLDSEGDEDDDDDDGTGNRKKRARRRETARRRTRLLALAVLAIAVMAISMALRSHTDGSSAPVPELVELIEQGDTGRIDIPDRHDEDPDEGEQWLLELLAQYTPIEVLRNSTSPQNRSMRWLLRSSDDGGGSGAVIDPFFRAYVRDGPVAAKKIAFEGSLLTHAVVERYALVTFYYATNGDGGGGGGGGDGGGGDVHGVGGTAQSGGPVVVDDAEKASSLRTKKGALGGPSVGSGGWKDDSMWLSPYHHCEWAGVVCSLGKGYRKEITELRLSGNGLRGGPLPAELGALDRLERLHLGGGNDITGTLPTEGLFGRLTRLREVRLEGNGLSGPLPIDIGGDWSPLDGDGEDGGTGTHAGRALEVLDLTNNRISGRLPPSLGKLHKLSALRLSNNRLGGDLGDVLSVLGGLDTLEVLLLDGNDIGGSIPESIGSLPSLRRLRLSNNAVVDSVPPSVGELGNLLELDLSHNRLDGTLPVQGDQKGGGSAAGLNDLTSLETLVLSGNAFHGRIFESSLFATDDPRRPRRGLSELRRLRLDGNAFSGTIAPWISGENLVALEELYVSDNSFSGEVPDELGSLTTLRELAVEGNDMVGSVPESLCRLHLRLLSADCGGDGGGGGGDDGSTMTCSCCTECVG